MTGRLVQSIPLRVKLVAAVLALVTLALLLIGVVSAVALRSYLIDRVDGQIEATAKTIDINAMRNAPAATPFSLPSDYLIGLGSRQHIDFVDARRSEKDLPPMPVGDEIMKRANKAYTASAVGSRERWRLLIRPIGVDQVLIVGESLAAMDDAVDRLVAVELIIGVGVLAVLASLGVGIVQASLRPLREIETTAAAIAAGDLTRRVPESDPDTEIGRLASAFNAMLAQIEGAFAERAASEERMRQFVADASHELRTPLTTIRGFAELYRQGAATSPVDTRALLKRIEDEAARMGLLVEDLLLLARLDRERPLTLGPVELRMIAADAAAAARAVAPDRDITVDVVGDGPFTVLGDEPRLRQVVGNLMTNALTHTPAGTAVTLRVSAEPPDAVIQVADAGQGLTAQQSQRVFERFYRVDKARTRQAAGSAHAVSPHSGSGLGLAIVAALVSAHRGTVAVESVEGTGATFRVQLPLLPISPEWTDDDGPVGLPAEAPPKQG